MIMIFTFFSMNNDFSILLPFSEKRNESLGTSSLLPDIKRLQAGRIPLCCTEQKAPIASLITTFPCGRACSRSHAYITFSARLDQIDNILALSE